MGVSRRERRERGPVALEYRVLPLVTAVPDPPAAGNHNIPERRIAPREDKTVENAVAPLAGERGVLGIEHHEEHGWLRGSFYHHDPKRERVEQPYPRRLDVREIDGEPAVLVFQGSPEALEEIWRFEEMSGRISHIRDYCFSPHLVRFVAETLSVPFRELGHRVEPAFAASAPGSLEPQAPSE